VFCGPNELGRSASLTYRCATCGDVHDEVPSAFVASLPDYARQVPESERPGRVLASSDQCVVDEEHYFILGNLSLPVRGKRAELTWTVWTSLSEKNFMRASELWEEVGREAEPPYFGWLGNQIPGYPKSLNIKTVVHTQPVGVRPLIEVIEEDHPIARDQRRGLSLKRYHALVQEALHG
jgi:hypothetical protein